MPSQTDWSAVGGRPSPSQWAAVGGSVSATGARTRPPASSPALPQGRYGSEIEREALALDPNLVVTGRARSAARNRQVTGVPNSAHLTDNARDFVPRRGESLGQARSRLEGAFGPAGYKVIVEGPGAAHSTGPHIHVEATQAAKDFPEPKVASPADWAAVGGTSAAWKAVGGAPTTTPSGVVKQKAAQARKAEPKDSGHWYDGIVEGVENIPSSAVNAAKGFAQAVRHPADTLAGLSDAGLGAVESGIRSIAGRDLKPIRGEKPAAAQARREQHGKAWEATKEFYGDRYGGLPNIAKTLRTDPVGAALDASMVLGGGSAALKLARRSGTLGKVAEARAPWTKITRPEMVDAASRKAAPVVSRALSRADLRKRQHLAQIEKHYEAFNGATPEEHRDVVRVVEGHQPHAPLTPARQAAATAVKKILDESGQDLEAATGVPLRPGYFPHKWEAPTPKAAGRGPSKVGSGAQVKARKFNTIDEGLADGFREVHPHPLDAVAHYIEDTHNRIAHENVLDALKKGGQAKWFPSRAVPDGWTKLDGPSTTRDAKPLTKDMDGLPVLTGQVPARVLAAPDSVARLHNNRLAPSIADSAAGALYKPVAAATNAAKTGVLGGGSLAHTALTMIKGAGSDMARGTNDVLVGAGDLAKSVKGLSMSDALAASKKMALGAGRVAVSATAPFRQVYQVAKAEKALLTHGPREEWEHLYIDAGGRVSQEASYQTSMKPNLYESWRRKTFVQDLKKSFAEVGRQKGGQAWKAAAKGAGETFSRTLETANHFTFKFQVPRIKLGVAKSEIEGFLKNNPGLSHEDKLAAARRIVSSIDNRFGEMVADNNFWHAYYKEASRAALLSPSWVQGNVRLFTDAAKDLAPSLRAVAKGKGMNIETQAAFGVWASRTLAAGILTYLMTGEAPQGTDWVAPRTGGKTKDGSPERMTVLSSMKDVDQLLYGGAPTTEAFGKLNPAFQMAVEMAENKDYFDHPIVRPMGVDPLDENDNRVAEGAQFVGKSVLPIGLQGDDNPDSHLSSLARFVGAMPAGQKYFDPEGYAGNQQKYGGKAWLAKRRYDERHKQ